MKNKTCKNLLELFFIFLLSCLLLITIDIFASDNLLLEKKEKTEQEETFAHSKNNSEKDNRYKEWILFAGFGIIFFTGIHYRKKLGEDTTKNNEKE